MVPGVWADRIGFELLTTQILSLLSPIPTSTHHISVPKTARYSLSGPQPGQGKGLLFALHGYGQLAPYFIRKLAAVAAEGWSVVAPEGNHRFYLKGNSGRVGASWMTAEDRLSDIDDLIGMLDLVYDEILASAQETAKTKLPIVVLGFSQGVPAALRWAAMGRAKFDRIIAHSGSFPTDLPEGSAPPSGWPPVDMLLGTEDPYIKSIGAEKATDIANASAARHGIPCEVHTFNGAHHIHPPSVLDRLGLLA